MPKCCYKNCENTQNLHRFPVQEPSRLEIWIANCGNIHLTSLTDNELHNRFLCSSHFKPSSVHVGTIRHRLLGPAVPMPYKYKTTDNENMEIDDLPSPAELKVLTPKKTYPKRQKTSAVRTPSATSSSERGTFSDLPDTPRRHLSRKCAWEEPAERPSRKDTPRKCNLKKKINIFKRRCNSQGQQLKRMSLKLAQQKNKNIINIERHKFQSAASKSLVLMQMRKENTKKKWSKEEKKLCTALYYRSPEAYTFMRRQGIVLAAPTTIKLWLSKTDCSPGISQEVFTQIKNKFEHAKTIKERACIICFDEMSIMQSLEYNKKYDMIEGYEDLGGNRRTNQIAKYALVFLARGLYAPWKLPVAYYLAAKNVGAEDLQHILKTIINKLFESNLLPKAIVCDQMTGNQKLFKNLGITTESPFFFCNERKLFAFVDFPHAIKNLRNNFLNNDFLIDQNTLVSFKDIIKTYEIDNNKKSRALTKITQTHLNPNSFQKMNVKLATQIFSHSVSAAISAAKDSGELKSDTAYDTAKFVSDTNNLFDAMNAKNKKDKNPYRRGLTKSMRLSRKALLRGKELFKSIKKVTIKQTKKGTIKKTITRPPSFEGIVLSIEAALQMFQEENTEDIDFLLTNRLTQDVLENLFARFRLKSGWNRNPTARVIRTIFRSNLTNSLIKLPDKKNCEDSEDAFDSLDESNASVPHSSASVPHSNAPVHHSSASVPLSPAPVCQSSASEPHSYAPVPHSNISVPHSNAPVSHSSASVPHSPAPVCQSSASVPHSSASVPHSPAPVCQSSASVPHSGGSVPHSSDTEPHSYAPVPHSNISVPHFSASVLHSSDSEPHSSASVPHSSASVPHSDAYVPQSSASATSTGTLEQCSIAYFAGYLAHKAIKKFDCQSCRYSLVKELELDTYNQNHHLILRKTFGFLNEIRLKAPSDQFHDLIEEALQIFLDNFQQISCKLGIIETLYKCIINHIKCEKPQLLELCCLEHIRFIIEHLLFVKINDFCKREKKRTIQENKPHSKLRILKNQ